MSHPKDAKPPDGEVPLEKALSQTERTRAKVEQAAEALSSVNAVLKEEVSVQPTTPAIHEAVARSETIEADVEEAAAELVSVNEALTTELRERKGLNEALARSEAALFQSGVQEKAARHASLHDPLCGLPNLTLFKDRLQTAIAQADRHAWRLAIMFIDLDGFKTINDVHGHDVGDRIIQIVAERLQGVVRAEDTVSRRSGDEFLVLMLEAEGEATAAALAGRILASLAQECVVGELHLTVTASLGITIYPDDARSIEDLLRHADTAMYSAKRQDGNCVFYSACKTA